MSVVAPELLVQTGPMIEKGDCGVILKPDGTFRIFSTGMEDVTSDALTPAQIEQGNRIAAISVMLQSPQLLDMMMSVLNDPTMVDQARIVNTGVKH